MARLNVEDDIFRSPCFHEFVESQNGDMAKALGLLILFWFAAQKRWAQGELLPRSEFRKGWQPILDCGLAEEREAGIYAKGSEEQFAWLVQKVTAGREGGIRSGVKRREAAVKRQASGANPLTPPLTLSLSQEDLVVVTEIETRGAELPPPLQQPRIREILERRKITDRGLSAWLHAFPDPQWLQTEIIMWDGEADDSPEFSKLPAPTRFRKWAEKHWAAHRQKLATQPPEDVDQSDPVASIVPMVRWSEKTKRSESIGVGEDRVKEFEAQGWERAL